MIDLPKEFQVLAEEVGRQRAEPPSILKNQLQLDQLKTELRERKGFEVASLIVKLENENSKAKKPTSLSPLHCSYVLNEYLTFCMFDDSEGQRLAMYVPEEGIYTQNESLMRKVISWLEPSLDHRKAGTVLYHLRNQADVKPKTISRFLIPVQNGVFNLETKQLENFTPDYVFTSKIATPYIDNPPLPTIDGWNVEEWLKGLASHEEDTELLLWQVISACMNGNYTRKQSIWLYSDGNTGKGTYQQLIMNLVGFENVAMLKLPQFGERFATSMLEGKVCVIGDDVPASVYIDDSSVFNSFVTGDPIMIEQKNKPAYSATFNMTVLQSTNGLPRIHNKSNGTYKRFLIVEFRQVFDKEKDNWKIKEEYIKRSDVLEYVLNKAIKLDFEKFITPKASEQLLENYKIENDPVRDFKVSIFDNFQSTRIPVYLVYQYYIDFCEESRYKVMTMRNFTNQFERLLDDDWTKKSAQLGNFFKEKYLPTQLDKNHNIEKPALDKIYKCFVNTRLELVS